MATPGVGCDDAATPKVGEDDAANPQARTSRVRRRHGLTFQQLTQQATKVFLVTTRDLSLILDVFPNMETDPWVIRQFMCFVYLLQ